MPSKPEERCETCRVYTYTEPLSQVTLDIWASHEVSALHNNLIIKSANYVLASPLLIGQKVRV